ncbi:MAG: hypothetical protein ABI537_03095 [Casimicrobiaceae bacterium]
MSKLSGLANWAAVLAAAAFATPYPAGGDTLPVPQAEAVQVVFEVGNGVANDDPASSTADESVRPANSPALPVNRKSPSRRCGNIMRDLDDLCQYAGAVRAAASTLSARH